VPIGLEDMLVPLKTDDIDLVVIGDLLMRGKGYKYNLEKAGTYLNLREETALDEKRSSRCKLVLKTK